jgi:hypothetical protein
MGWITNNFMDSLTHERTWICGKLFGRVLAPEEDHSISENSLFLRYWLLSTRLDYNILEVSKGQ